MLLVKARAGISKIHGIGLIAREFIPRGTRVWRFEPSFDLVFTGEQVLSLPSGTRDQVLWYAYHDTTKNIYVLSGDDDRFTNHSDDPNTQDEDHRTYAASYAIKDIQPGEEITWDYRPWGGVGFGHDLRKEEICGAVIRRAKAEDIDQLQSLFAEVIAWQRRRGAPAFSNFSRTFLAQEIGQGSMFVAQRGENLVGTISHYDADDLIWGPDPAPALYLHRLATSRTMETRGLGAALLEWSWRRALDLDKQWLRFDCWADNVELCRFYQSLGFQFVCDKYFGENDGLPDHYQNVKMRLIQKMVGTTWKLHGQNNAKLNQGSGEEKAGS